MTAISKFTGGLNAAFDAMTNTPLKKYSLAATSALLAVCSVWMTIDLIKSFQGNRRHLSTATTYFAKAAAVDRIHRCRIMMFVTIPSALCFSALCVSALRR